MPLIIISIERRRPAAPAGWHVRAGDVQGGQRSGLLRRENDRWSATASCFDDLAWHLMNVAVAPGALASRDRLASDHRCPEADRGRRAGDVGSQADQPFGDRALRRPGFRSYGLRRGYYPDNGEDAPIMGRVTRGRRSSVGIDRWTRRFHRGPEMPLLAIETSCDDTCAVAPDGLRIPERHFAGRSRALRGVGPRSCVTASLELAVPRGRSRADRCGSGLTTPTGRGHRRALGPPGALLVGSVPWRSPRCGDCPRSRPTICTAMSPPILDPTRSSHPSSARDRFRRSHHAGRRAGPSRFRGSRGNPDDAAGEVIDKAARLLGPGPRAALNWNGRRRWRPASLHLPVASERGPGLTSASAARRRRWSTSAGNWGGRDRKAGRRSGCRLPGCRG